MFTKKKTLESFRNKSRTFMREKKKSFSTLAALVAEAAQKYATLSIKRQKRAQPQ